MHKHSNQDSSDNLLSLLRENVFSLVSKHDEVKIEVTRRPRRVFYEVSVASSDVGFLLGRGGKHIQAIRTLVSAAAGKYGLKPEIDVVL